MESIALAQFGWDILLAAIVGGAVYGGIRADLRFMTYRIVLLEKKVFGEKSKASDLAPFN